MKAFCINLQRSTDRRAYCEKQFEQIGLNGVYFMPGVDGAALVPKGQAYTEEYGALGCCRSHRKVWSAIIHGAMVEPVLVLEDDPRFHPSFPLYLTQWAKELPPDWDIAWWGYHNIDIKKPVSSFLMNYVWKRIDGGDYRSTVAYSVNGPEAARKLLAQTDDSTEHLDIQMFRAVREGRITAYFAHVPIVSQGTFKSTISA